jgi:Zn ribbon nucleic-acid-binding protein
MIPCPTCGTDDKLRFSIKDGVHGYDCRGCGGRVESEPEPTVAAARAPKPQRKTAPGGRDQTVLDALLRGVAEHGGTATTVDMRDAVRKVRSQMSDENLRSHLGHLCDNYRPAQLERPFGRADRTGDTKARMAWLQEHRPDQVVHRPQVWRLTKDASKELRDLASEKSAATADQG